MILVVTITGWGVDLRYTSPMDPIMGFHPARRSCKIDCRNEDSSPGFYPVRAPEVMDGLRLDDLWLEFIHQTFRREFSAGKDLLMSGFAIIT